MSTTFEKILTVFKENGNLPLTTKDIYEQLEKKRVSIGGKTPIYTISGEISRSNKKARLLNNVLPFYAKGKRGAVKYYINEQYLKQLKSNQNSKRKHSKVQQLFSSSFRNLHYESEALRGPISEEECLPNEYIPFTPNSPPPSSPSSISSSKHSSEKGIIYSSETGNSFVDVESLDFEDTICYCPKYSEENKSVCSSQHSLPTSVPLRKGHPYWFKSQTSKQIEPKPNSNNHESIVDIFQLLSQQPRFTSADESEKLVRRVLDMVYICEKGQYEFVLLWKDGNVTHIPMQEAKNKYPNKVYMFYMSRLWS